MAGEGVDTGAVGFGDGDFDRHGCRMIVVLYVWASVLVYAVELCREGIRPPA